MGADGMAEPIVPERQDNYRLLVVLICIVGLIGVVGIVLEGASISKLNMGNSGADSGNNEKIWTFAIGHDGTNLEYIEEQSGTLRGFHVDVVNAVCEIANKNCRLIWDIYQNCWLSEAGARARGGIGLMSRWYDACTGWFNTYDRVLTVDFTVAFRKPLMAVFYVKKGDIADFQWTNLTGKKIGFLDGWAEDEHCIARMGDKITGIPLEKSQIMHYTTLDDIVAAVNSGEVAAIFINTNQYEIDSEQLDAVSDELLCVNDGGSMMMRKDTLLSEWWNPAFSRLKETNQYSDICKRVDADHGNQPGASGDVICVD